ncbi:nuclear transport factor 2 family protein [Flavobacterium sp.]|uniref:nuclear transport factor 2 family protein n=1 Tax=Flavobacterium sp. TaxID=239 RepID=UPI00286C2C7D|nr:nuclear transport factor 2 family protein [Flavobacterium sp.]
MKKIALVIIFIFSINSNAQNEDVKHTVETFFEGFQHRDTLLLHQVCADKMILQSITENEKGNQFSEESTKEFYQTIAAIPKDLIFREQLLSFTIQVDGSMAHAWTPYEFFVDGKLSHKGVNAFTLFKEKDRWKIVYIIDTRRK